MGFYGNITNTARTQFAFDKIYSSRYEMDRQRVGDGVFAGRFVLVEYDKHYSTEDFFRVYIKDDNFYSAADCSKNSRIIYDTTLANVDQQTLVITKGAIVYDIDDLTNYYHFYVCDGQDAQNYATFRPVETLNSYGGTIDNYVYNYNLDQAYAKSLGTSAGRGWDSTVWQKIYSGNEVKYVMIAELNTIVPTFDMTSDAPTDMPVNPHFDESSTNVYYKLHMQPQWGLRIKAASKDAVVSNLDSNGNVLKEQSNASKDTCQYPSDVQTSWVKDFYDKDTGKRIKKYYDPETGEWSLEEKALDAAIYYNKAGFDEKTITYSQDNVSEGWNGQDAIKLESTGLSGQKYYNHDIIGGEPRPQVDTKEFSAMLPSIGDSIAKMWDLVYGGRETAPEIKDSNERNLDIAWEDGDTIERKGLRLVNEDKEGNGFTYDRKQVNTLAGSINSVHDLMGMIIDDKEVDPATLSSSTIEENYFDDKIYYFSEDGTYRRKISNIKENTLEIYDYKETLVKEDTYNKNQYYIKSGEDFIPATGEYDSEEVYYVRVPRIEIYKPVTIIKYQPNRFYINTTEDNYLLSADAEAVSGTVYYDIDRGEALQFEDSYRPGDYYYLSEGNYFLDNNVSADLENHEYFRVSIKEDSHIQGLCYHPNMYSYKNPTDESSYLIDTAPKMTAGRIYYIVDYKTTSIRVPQNYEPIELTEQTYRQNTFYIKISDTEYEISEGEFDPNASYFNGINIKTEKFQEVIREEEVNLIPYEENKYYYLSGDADYILATEIEGVDQTDYFELETSDALHFYTADTYWYLADNGRDYLKDRNTEVTLDRKYYILETQRVEDESNQQFLFKENFIYEKSGDKYIIAKEYDSSKQYYYKTPYYVMEDSLDIYQPGAEWNYAVDAIPHTVTLCSHETVYELQELKGFARDLNTIHGLILKINSLLEFDSETRDRETLQGALNSLNDTIDKFSELIPGNILLIDQYGRIHSSPQTTKEVLNWKNLGNKDTSHNTEAEENKFIELYINDNSEAPMITLKHADAHTVQDTVTTADKNVPLALSSKDSGINNTNDDTLKLYTPIIDNKGHVIGKNEETVTLPFGFKILKTQNSQDDEHQWSQAGQAASIGEEVADIVADNTKDSLSIVGGNKWIRFKSSGDGNLATNSLVKGEDANTLTIAHETHDFDVAEVQETNLNTEAGATLESNINIPDWEYDIAGHITAKKTHKYTLPYGFKTIKTNGRATEVSENATGTPVITDVVADTTQDILTINSGNKWIRIDTDKDADSIAIRHDVHAFELSDKSSSDINGNGDIITIQDIEFDEAGHMTKNQNHTYTLPYGYKSFSGDSGQSTASNTQDSFEILGDDWIKTTVSDNKIELTHIGPVAVEHVAVNNETPAFGSAFTIKDLTFDGKGHKTSEGTHTITIPKGSLNDAAANNADVITQLSFVDTTGALSTTRTNVGNLLLTGYSVGSNAKIAATDSVNAAFGKIQGQINAMDYTDTASTTQFITEINEVDGIIAPARGYAGTLKIAADGHTLKEIDDAVNTLTSGSTTEGSVAYQIAQIVNDNNNGSIDTLNEIAAWIINDTTGAAKMQSDISELQGLVGEDSVASQIDNLGIDDYLKKEDATGYNDILTKTIAAQTYQTKLTANTDYLAPGTTFTYKDEQKTISDLFDIIASLEARIAELENPTLPEEEETP